MVWNEYQGCRQVVPEIPYDLFNEVFALDGGSTDGTVEYLRKIGVQVVPQRQKGYNIAYIEAFERTEADFLIFFHPKGSIDPRSLARCVNLAREGYDLVIASRNIKDAKNEEDDQLFKPRKTFVNVLALLSALLWKRDRPMIWDVLHGYRGMSKKAFETIDPLRQGLSMDLEMVVRSYKLRLSRIEYPVQEKPREHGNTHFNAFPTGWELLKYIKYELFRSDSS